MRIRLGHLSPDEEAAMVRRRLGNGAVPAVLSRVVDAERLLAMRDSIERVHVEPDVVGYAVGLITATRTHPHVTVGASPRATLATVQLARGHAVLDHRDYVLPEDVKAIAIPALAHRLVLRPEMWVRQITDEDVLTEILDRTPVPRTPS
jgi:MoxR-like ATPase